MSFSAYLQLDTRRKKGNGSYPLIVRITVNRKTTSLQTNINLLEKEWDFKHSKIKASAKSYPNSARINNYIQHYLGVSQKVLLNLSESNKLHLHSLTEIKTLISKELDSKSSELTLDVLIDAHIDKMNKEKRYGTARTYKDLKQFLEKYCDTSSIPITKVDFKWLSNIESEYKAKGNSLNGLGVRLRALRALININRKSGALPEGFNPFENYTIKSLKTRKRALVKDDFDKILNADVSKLPVPLQRARELFLVSYYMLGISFYDMALLTIDNIADGKIYYRRSKTKRLYAVKISKRLEVLLKVFIEGKEKDDFLFPIASKGLSGVQQSNRIRNAMARYNRDLKKLAEILGIESQRLSSYVARHSVATHARDVANIDIPVISQMLGHNDTTTTAVYLASIQDSVLDDAVEKMFE